MSKFRFSFVTNSSSSSFVVAYKSIPEIDEETINKYPFLKNYSSMIDKLLLTETEYTSKGNIFKTKDEIEKYMLWHYDCDTIEELKEEIGEELYNKFMKYINDGFNILFKDVDYNDECFVYMIKQATEDNDDFVILEEYV